MLPIRRSRQCLKVGPAKGPQEIYALTDYLLDTSAFLWSSFSIRTQPHHLSRPCAVL